MLRKFIYSDGVSNVTVYRHSETDAITQIFYFGKKEIPFYVDCGRTRLAKIEYSPSHNPWFFNITAPNLKRMMRLLLLNEYTCPERKNIDEPQTSCKI